MIPKPVKAGDLVLPAWREVLESLLSLTILPGRGILLSKHPGGTIINARSALGFSGAWKVSAGTNSVKVARGFVNALEPMVKDKLLSAAEIPYKPADFKDGRLWVGIKVTVDPDTGKMKHSTQDTLTEKDLTVVVQGSPLSGDATGTVGFHPVAMLLEKPALRAVQIAYFDYQHATSKKPAGTGKGYRHFFFPA